MEFTNLFSPVHLGSDPIFGSNGQLYFNTASNVYRLYYNESWVSIIDAENIPKPKSFLVGNSSSATVNTTISSEYIDSTIVAFSASTNVIEIPISTLSEIPAGSYIDIIRGGPGIVNIVADLGVTFQEPSSIYLTANWLSVRITKIADNEWVLGGEFPDIY